MSKHILVKHKLIIAIIFLLSGPMIVAHESSGYKTRTMISTGAMSSGQLKNSLHCVVEIMDAENPPNCEQDRYSEQVQKIYNRYLRKNPGGTGNIYISLTTDKEGNILSVNVETNIQSDYLLKRLHVFSKIYHYPESIMFNRTINYTFSPVE